MSLLGQSPICGRRRQKSPQSPQQFAQIANMGSGRVTCYTVVTRIFFVLPNLAPVTDVEGAGYFPGGAPKKRSDGSNGFSYLWSAKLRSLPRLGSESKAQYYYFLFVQGWVSSGASRSRILQLLLILRMVYDRARQGCIRPSSPGGDPCWRTHFVTFRMMSFQPRRNLEILR